MKNRKIQLTFRFFKGAKKYFAVAVIASFITTVFNWCFLCYDVVYEQKIIRYCTSICSGYCSVFGNILSTDCQKIYGCRRGRRRIIYSSTGKCNRSPRCAGVWTGTV